MQYAIIGFGAVGQALARAFARKGIEVAVALTPLAREIGRTIIPKPLPDALKSEIVILAVPFWQHQGVAKAAASWKGKIVIDATNAFGIPLEELDDLPSSVVISRALAAASLVKAFNHLPAGTRAEDPNVRSGRRVVFLSSDDESATVRVAELVEQRLRASRAGEARRRRIARPGARTYLGSAYFSGSRQIPVKAYANGGG